MEVLDTTLRDGAQAQGVTFSLQDKISLVERLDDLGVKYIEGGWPSSNLKDMKFFKAVKQISLKNSKIVACSTTYKRGSSPSKDKGLNALLKVDLDTAVIIGKSWDLHVKEILKAELDENITMIQESIEYLRSHGIRVIFDAEHFYDGYSANREYSLRVIKAAEESGAEVIVLCDTNGGTTISRFNEITKDALAKLNTKVGVHCHNDLGLAVANTLVAIELGVEHIQGTINGFGERCGNADLCQLIPTIQLKMGISALKSTKPLSEQLRSLTALSRYVYELTNITPDPYKPYVGINAFAHKAGIHIDAILKNPRAYEHIDPSLVGNKRRIAISELSGRSAVVNEALKLGIKLDKESEMVDKILNEIKRLEAQGYYLENANATVHLIILKAMGYDLQPFTLKFWRVTTEKFEQTFATSEVLVNVKRESIHEAAVGVGPVHALDRALRKALLKRFPILRKTQLINYKVSVVESGGTASSVRVFIEFKDDNYNWATTALSRNILEASIKALVDGYTYRLALEKLKVNGINTN
ncbi:MAG: citramalate synthase [Nitrososphaerales archaeon]|nr:citramalate synthase [Nitrososphaerales archaeon]